MTPTRPTRLERVRVRFAGVPRTPREVEHSLCILGDLRRVGWHHSANARVPLLGGEPVPWLTYPAIYWLQGRFRGTELLFEYGGGNSTLWFATQVRRVVTVEHNRDWYERLSARSPGNVSVLYRPTHDVDASKAYVEAIHASGELTDGQPFDVIVIDGGPSRASCVSPSIRALHPGGLIVFDDTDLPEYHSGLSELRAAGFERIDFMGPRPGAKYMGVTSVLSRDFPTWLGHQDLPRFRTWWCSRDSA